MPRTPLRLQEVVEKCNDPTYRPDIFCHRELPVLLAHMIHQIEKFPLGLSAMSDTRTVKSVLQESFRRLTTCPVPSDSAAEMKRFVEIVRDTDTKHDDLVITLAKGIIELRKMLTRHRDALNKSRERYKSVAAAAALAKGGAVPAPAPATSDAASSGRSSSSVNVTDSHLASSSELQASLDAFYLDFLKFKFIARQLVSLYDAGFSATKSFTSCGDEVKKVGMVAESIDLRDVVRKAAHQAEMICTEHYGDCPKIRVVVDRWKIDQPIPHLEDTIIYVMVELLKNSLRATVETHLKRDSMNMVTCADMPPVVVSLSSNSHSATIVVSDQGGGIPRREVAKAMSYAFTTVSKPALEQQPASPDGAEPAPSMLAGYGYGLPMSRLYTRLFGGDLQLHSMEGFGTDVYVTFAKQGG